MTYTIVSINHIITYLTKDFAFTACFNPSLLLSDSNEAPLFEDDPIHTNISNPRHFDCFLLFPVILDIIARLNAPRIQFYIIGYDSHLIQYHLMPPLFIKESHFTNDDINFALNAIFFNQLNNNFHCNFIDDKFKSIQLIFITYPN